MRLIKDTRCYVDPDDYYNDIFDGYMAWSEDEAITDIKTIINHLSEKGWNVLSENEISNEEINVKLTLNPCVLYTVRSILNNEPNWVPKPYGLFGYGILCDVEDLHGNTLDVMDPLEWFYGDVTPLSHWDD